MAYKQVNQMPPIYRGDDREVMEWAKNLVQFLNQELLKISGRLNNIDDEITAIEARLTGHGI